MKYFFSFIVLVNSLGGVSQQLSGTVLDSITKKKLGNCKIYLTSPLVNFDFEKALPEIQEKCYWYQGKYFLKLANSVTNSQGEYHFSNIQPGTYAVISEYNMPILRDSLYSTRSSIRRNIEIGRNKVNVEEMYLMVTCPYDRSKELNHCPRCRKSTHLIPIVFGLILYDENGKSPYGDKKIYNPSCTKDPYCNPTQYCESCKLEF